MTSPRFGAAPEGAEFRAPSSRGQTLELDTFLGKVPVVLCFVRDLDGGAVPTLEALDRNEVAFGRRRAQLLVAVRATSHEVRDAAERHHLTVAVLADPDGAIARAYGVSDDTDRHAVVIDCDGSATHVAGSKESPEEWAGVLLHSLDGNDVPESTPLGPQSDRPGPS